MIIKFAKMTEELHISGKINNNTESNNIIESNKTNNNLYINYEAFMDDEEYQSVINGKRKCHLIEDDNNEAINNVFRLIKNELDERDISYQHFKSKLYEYNLLNILFHCECDSKEYIERKLKEKNKTYNNSIYSLLEIPIIFDFIMNKYGNYCINGLNIPSFIQCCKMNFYYLAKLMSKMILITPFELKSIFSQSCLNIEPKYVKLIYDIDADICNEVLNNSNLLDIIMISMKNYIDSIIAVKDIKLKLIHDKEVQLIEMVKVFTDMNPNNIYFYFAKRLVGSNGKVVNITLSTKKINKYKFIRSNKLESIDDNELLTDDQKIMLKKLPVKDDLCCICYEKKPNIITSCNNNDVTAHHQYCNSCISKLVLNMMPCPMCRQIIDVNKLCCITTDIRLIDK